MSSARVLQREKDLRAKLEAAKAKAVPLMEAAESENRALTAEERATIDASLAECREIKAQLDAIGADREVRDQIAALTAGSDRPTTTDRRPPSSTTRSLGQQFVDSEAYEFIRHGMHRGRSAWQTPTVELEAATLTTDAASGGDLIVSDYRPGIQPLLFRRMVVADLIAPGTTDSNSVTYMQETTFTNAAAAVAEGAAKPESTLVFDQVTDAVRKIAHWLPVSEEMLEDVAGIRSYIDSRLRLGVLLTEEDQLLNGSGVAPNILGIRNRTGLTADVVRGTDTEADAILRQIMGIFTASLVMPDGVVIHPTDWTRILLTKDDGGGYYTPGPFSAIQTPTLWGLPAVVTPVITTGTALVGAFRQSAQFFRKGGLRVEASNSHSDYFVKNLVAIRAEERGALAVYRPAAFGEVTGLSAA